jgi:hypothetical protein
MEFNLNLNNQNFSCIPKISEGFNGTHISKYDCTPVNKETFENVLTEAEMNNFPNSGLQVWFDTTDSKSIKPTGLDRLEWYSKVNTSFSLQTSNARTSPTITKNVLNNLPVMSFTINQNMQLNKNLESPVYTFVFLARQLKQRNGRFFVGNENRLLGYHGGKKGVVHLNGWQGSDRGLVSNDEWDLMVLKRNTNGKSTISRNGTILQKDVNGGQGFNGLNINSGLKHCCNNETSDGQVAEILFWNRVISDSETVFVENYLASKWGMRRMLDDKHPSYLPPPPNAEAPIAGFPVTHIQLWLDATTFTGKNGTTQKVWPGKTLDKNYFFQSSNPPLVVDNGLNNKTVLSFNTVNNMGINKPLKSEAYTFVYLARQLKKTNRRFFIGNQNRLLGYHNGKKGVVFLNGWQGSDRGLPSNDAWDLMVLRRDIQGKCTISRNGEVMQKDVTGGQDFDGLYINIGDGHNHNNETSDGQVAEILFWNSYLDDAKTIIVESYLAKKWGIEKLLDFKHPSYPQPRPNAESEISGFPVKHIQLWVDATIFAGQNGNKPKVWSGKTLDNNYFFTSTNPPIVVDNELNNRTVLSFTKLPSMSITLLSLTIKNTS